MTALVFGPANAEPSPDQSGSGLIAPGMFGDGQDGDLAVAPGQTVDGTTVRSEVAGNSPAGQPTLAVTNTVPFSPGDEVLIIQMQGTGAGLYEFGTIALKDSGSFTMQEPLSHSYTAGGGNKAQVLKVPHYGNVTIQGGGVLTAPAWDGGTGGLLVFRANGALTVNSGGTVTMAGRGYRGAPTNGTGRGGSQGEGQDGPGSQSTAPNGSGGGGGCSNGFGNPAGGGGGGHGTPGTSGNPGNNNNCDVPGAGGGAVGTTDLKQAVFPGGGGGSGGAKDPANGNHPGGFGGSGGGIVIIFASSAAVDGTFTANGQNGGLGNGFNTSANGGGGAGGAILLVVGAGSVSTSLDAVNGLGGSYPNDGTENGGPGGLGRILVHFCDSFSGSANPPAMVEQVTCNAAPVAQDDAYQTAEDTALTVPAPGVLGNDTDPDGDPLTATLVSGPTNGSLDLNPDGSFTYTPATNFAGDDSFTYQASDGASQSNTATVTVTVTPGPQTVTLAAVADTYVRSGQGDRNLGAGTFMRIQANGDNRALVRFDQAAIQSAIGTGIVLSATLRLTIVDNSNNWGPTGRTVDVHKLLSNWAEGNGTEPNRGTGAGATWNCAVDSNIANQAKDCTGPTEWEMGQPNNPTVHPWLQVPTDTITITNGQTGVVEYDVTADVSAFVTGINNYGWILKKTNEAQNGSVSLGTKENPSGAELIITYQP